MKGYVIENWLWFVIAILVIAVQLVYFPVH